MKYPINCKNIIDVTKPPYNADSSGRYDCTAALCKALDDVLRREAEGVNETAEKLLNAGGDMYIGFETRIVNGKMNVIYPEFVPPSRIIYFPSGTYLVSDTVTYSLYLKNIFNGKRFYELARGIHIVGESRDSVTIRLMDNSYGFGKGEQKPVLSIFNVPDCCKKPCSNVCQLNTVEDITIDCGEGNPGAVGLRFMANNSGRVQNVTIKAKEGYAGLQTAWKTEGSFVNITAEGFDYGADIPASSICVFENMELSENKYAAFKTHNSYAVFNNIKSAPLPLLECEETNDVGIGKYYVVGCDSDCKTESFGNEVFYEESTWGMIRPEIPEFKRLDIPEDYALVDDFGAVADGKTDCTEAIQKAFDSGRPIVVFGAGYYFVNGEIKVPSTVKKIDFMYCDFFAGENLISGKTDCLFNVNEASEDILFFENLYTYDRFYGHMRLIKHSAVRDICLSDIHTQAASMYFNTVGGSRIYMDNCASTTGTYSYDLILDREGKEPEYSRVIPLEFHGQKVYGRQVNPERADVELLNDGSEILIDAYKVEGPGTAVKTINGGKTQINVFTAGIGYVKADNALFETVDSKLYFTGGIMSGYMEKTRYNIIFENTLDGDKKQLLYTDIENKPRPFTVSVGKHYTD